MKKKSSPIPSSITRFLQKYRLDNVTIESHANVLIERTLEMGNWDELARQMEERLRHVAALTGDEQMVQDADLFRRYQVTLAEALGGEPEPTTYQTLPSDGRQPQRWGVAGTPTLPEVEIK